MIAIMGAMLEEIDLIKAKMNVEKTIVIARREFHVGKLYGIDTVLVFAHYGKVSAAITSTLLFSHFDVAELLFIGVAGSANPDVRIGDIVIADHLIQHDMNCTPLFGLCEIPLLGLAAFSSDNALMTKAVQATTHYLTHTFHGTIGGTAQQFNITNPTCHIGAIASGDQFINNQDVATKIKIDTQPLLPSTLMAFEMEGAAVAHVCLEMQKPFVIIRTISDSADHSAHLDFPKFINAIARNYSLGIIEALYKLYYCTTPLSIEPQETVI